MREKWRQTWHELQTTSAINFFQTLDWAEILCRQYPFYHPEPIETQDLFFPLVRHHRYGKMSDSLYGMPMMTTGGCFLKNPRGKLDSEELLSLIRKAGVGTLVIGFPNAAPDWEVFDRIEDFSYQLGLDKGWEAVYAGFEHRARKAIRRASEQKVCVVCRNDPEAIAFHHTVMTEHQPLWKQKPSPSSGLIYELVQNPAGRLYIAIHEGSMIASLLALSYGEECYLWQGARSIARKVPSGTFNLLVAEAIKDACHQPDIRRVNLGTSLGIHGIDQFKKSFGGSLQKLGYLKWTHPMIRFIQRIRHIISLKS